MNDLVLRPATAADVPALHALVESAYRGEAARAGWSHEADLIQGPRTSGEALSALIDDPDEAMLLAIADGAPIGCVQLTRRGVDGAYLGLLAVHPRLQAAGLGKRIIALAEAEARRRFAARTIELTVVAQRAELIAWYERRGYALTGERRPFPIVFDPPFWLVVMAKPL